MNNLEQRVDFWSRHYKKECQGTTSILPISILQDICYKKDVLEIGPGEGRQYEHVQMFSKTYAIADVSFVVLRLPLYDAIDKYHIKSYQQEIPQHFDVIHAWFVLHHVLSEETVDFFSFVKRHLKSGGLFCFNISLHQSDKMHGEDGKKTVSRTEKEFAWFLQQQRCKVLYRQYIDVRSMVYIVSWETDKTLQLNIGGGYYWRMEDWVNIEKSRNVGSDKLQNFQECSISTVYCSHMLEHLPTYQALFTLLKTLYGILCNKGFMRIVIPSVNAINKTLDHTNREELLQKSAKYYQQHTNRSFTFHILDLIGLGDIDHHIMLNFEILYMLLSLVGYTKVQAVDYKSGAASFLDADIQINDKGFPLSGFDDADHKLISEYIEVIK